MHDDERHIDPKAARALWLGGVPSRQRGERSQRDVLDFAPRPRRRPLRRRTQLAAVAGTKGLSMYMSYAIGDYVVPTDLPRQFVCRVTDAHTVGGTSLQVLELAPLDGPWPPDTRLIRGGEVVRPAAPSELWDVWTSQPSALPEPIAPSRRRVPSRTRRPMRHSREPNAPGTV